MLTIAGGIILGFLGLALIIQPGFLSGVWALLQIGLYLGIAAAFVGAVALGQIEIAIGVGVVGVLFSAIGSAMREQPRTAASAASLENAIGGSPPTEPPSRPDVRDVLRGAANGPDPLAVRRRLVIVGLTVAARAVATGRTYADELETMAQRTEVEADAEVQRMKLTLFAADTFRDRTWSAARALILAVPQTTFEAELAAWFDRRLGLYLQRPLVDFGRLLKRPTFCAFAHDLDSWITGRRAAPPLWWVG